MNKTELIAVVAENSGLTKKDTERVINAAIDAITAALMKGEKVQISGFGSFETKDREARVGRNPHTKEAIDIPATRVPVFKASKALKDNVAKYGDPMRLDKYLKVSRVIKRRTVANEACDNGRISVNGRVVKASYDVKVGDKIEISMGARTVAVEVLQVAETVRKDDAAAMYKEV